MKFIERNGNIFPGDNEAFGFNWSLMNFVIAGACLSFELIFDEMLDGKWGF